MTARDDSREVVLSRVRDALGSAPGVPEVPRAYRLVGEHQPGSTALVELVVYRLEDYRATVVRAAGGCTDIDPGETASRIPHSRSTILASIRPHSDAMRSP